MSFMVDVKEIQVSKYGLTKVGKTPVLEIAFISGSGVMRGHGKTPSFMTGMKCLPHRHVLSMSAANVCMRPMQRYIF